MISKEHKPDPTEQTCERCGDTFTARGSHGATIYGATHKVDATLCSACLDWVNGPTQTYWETTPTSSISSSNAE